MPLEKEGVVHSGTADIYYYERGKGSPLVLLHGNGENRSCFDAQLPEFSKYYRCIVIESRGHGKSTRGAEPLSLSLFAEDTVAVLDALAIPRAHILGFSDGGNVALYLALKAPERILSLVLSGANSDPSGIVPKDLAFIKGNRSILKLRSLFSSAARRRLEIWDLMLKEPHISEKELSSITLPALITAGENDMILEEHTNYLHRCIKNSQIHIFSGCNHFVNSQQPKLYNKTVLNFLRAQEEK